MAEPAVIRIKPQFYVHVLDNNTNVTRVESGPQTFTRQDHEKLVEGPTKMIMIAPRHYCVIKHPIQRDQNGKPVKDNNGQVKLKYGDEEIRVEQEPFPLYPGETLVGAVTPLTVVEPNTALKLKCLRDFSEAAGKEQKTHVAGDEWLFRGPGTYLPRIEVQVVQVVKAVTIKPNQALKLKATKDFADREGAQRITGEEWLIRVPGSYLPSVEEEVGEVLSAYVLTDKKAIHLRASRTFKDVFGKERKAGQEWLVTLADADTHIADVYEQVVGEVKITSLSNRQFVVVLDPWQNGKQLLGKRELRKGETSFFLMPGERLESGIQNVYVLSDDEALLLRARESFTDPNDAHGAKDAKPVRRTAGDRWMVRGPCDYIPAVEVEIIEKRKTIPLDENEGIYVRDMGTGKVRSVTGESYMLTPTEELWKKDLPKAVEDILANEKKNDENFVERDRTRVVTYRAPQNSAVQLYDYKEKKARVIFGPDLVMLGPDEQFTVIDLSGDKPKRPHVIKALALLLGPDFMTDVVIVETSDHARLSLKLSYNWHFEIDQQKADEVEKLFQVPDFVGDSCKAIASRVRGAVAGVSFDAFHRNSAKIIRQAVFGVESEGQVKNRFHFSANHLVITNIDIQSVEPVDQRTRDSLQKSVQLAIQITTESQEASARHESTRLEQEAVGRLERQKISDEAEAERSRMELIRLQTESAAVESTGQAKAEAVARAESAKIQGEAAVEQARLAADASNIRTAAELQQMKNKQKADLEHSKAVNEMEIKRARDLAAIETGKFKQIVEAIGPNTIKSMAEAGPAMQVKLLQSLGLQSFLITDGNSPVNLFNTAQGLLGNAADAK